MTCSAIRLDGRGVGDGYPCYIIAEIGSNHNRNLETARGLIDVAKNAGCDAVKFQSYTADGLYSIYTPRISEMDGRSRDGETPYELIKRIQMPVEWHRELKAYCDAAGITFCSTPFDESMVDVLESVNVPFYKVASYEITHYPMLKKIAATGKPVILSTGNSDMRDVRSAVQVLTSNGCVQYALLHCVSMYPAPREEMNLRCIGALRAEFGCVVGLSDHTTDSMSSMLAVAAGAAIVEKHVTLDRTYPGPDHPFALEPAQLVELVRGIREAEQALGNPVKRVLDIEDENHRIGRRSIIAAVDMDKGTVLSPAHLVIKRPALGIHPGHLDEVIGRRTARSVKKDEWVTWEDLEQA